MILREIMNPNVVTVTPQTSLKELSSLLAARHISGAPVVDDGEVVGVVSESDIVAKESVSLEESSRFRRPRKRARQEELLGATLVEEVMSSPAVTIESWMSASAAAVRMVVADVNRLPVVDRDKLVGIVTRADLVKAFARSDADIAQELNAAVLPSLGLSPNDIAVSVVDGVVTLEGPVEDERDARTLTHAASSVIGVVRVQPKLTLATPVR